MNILITGCNGQLGNEMQLLEKVHPEHNYFNTDVAELDITNQEAIEAFVTEHEIDGIVRFLPTMCSTGPTILLMWRQMRPVLTAYMEVQNWLANRWRRNVASAL